MAMGKGFLHGGNEAFVFIAQVCAGKQFSNGCDVR
jgi:hypothetical protein